MDLFIAMETFKSLPLAEKSQTNHQPQDRYNYYNDDAIIIINTDKLNDGANSNKFIVLRTMEELHDILAHREDCFRSALRELMCTSLDSVFI